MTQNADTATPSGADLIAVERMRQIEAEGWTPEHDTEHDKGELVAAARSYLWSAMWLSRADDPETVGWHRLRPPFWPWGKEWWKPSDDPIRNLVKAGALIAAEIDRLSQSDGSETR